MLERVGEGWRFSSREKYADWAGYARRICDSLNPLILGLSRDEREAVAMRPGAFIAYRALYKCKHCGKEWTKLSVERIPIPREYVEAEREKTDYDAHLEEEEARKEEYPRK